MKRMIMRHIVLAAVVGPLAAGTGLAQTAPLPKLEKNGAATQLIVDGRPMILLAGELHNSSPSSPEYMAPIWDELQKMHLNAVIGAASWELIEPAPGRYDFAAVDDQLRQARAHGMRLVLIWFGSFKNASYTYAPMWVKRDPAKYPIAFARQKDGKLHSLNTLSIFGSASRAADAKAFAALMRHLREVDQQHTVVMMQVENETGIRDDYDSRDRSPAADAAWNAPVPAELMGWMNAHNDAMLPELKAVWTAAGAKTSGTWAEVFGSGSDGEEVFMAWFTARYLQEVAAAGQKELALPMYANAWLVQFPGETPGKYPSGGPVSRMMDVWRVGAPALGLFAPDIYLADFDGICASYTREGNPLFIPEARANVGNLFTAVGKYNAIGYSPFGIDGPLGDAMLPSAYEALNGLQAFIARAQAQGTIQLVGPVAGGQFDVKIVGYTAHVEIGTRIGPAPKVAVTQDVAPAPGEAVKAALAAAPQGFLHAFARDGRGEAMIIPDGAESFYVVGAGVAMTFGKEGRTARIGSIDEGRFVDGKWVAGRRLNGDESYGGYRVFLEGDAVRVVHVELYSVPQ